jgi:acyl-CoA thioesterase
VRWELFEPTDHHSVCPFKGEARYWSLIGSDQREDNVVWAYGAPFDEVGGIKGYVAFYQERVRIELEDHWPGPDSRAVTVNRFPTWGDAGDLVRLLDVQPAGPGHFVGPPYRDVSRNVVEGGQLLGQAVVAASKSLPQQRVTSAYMIFSKAATFDALLDVNVEVLRPGKTFSTVSVRIDQEEKLRSAGLLMLDSGSPDVIRADVDMPLVPGPYESEPFDMGVMGRDLRVVEGAYSDDPDRTGPPEIYAWMRLRDAPSEPYLHAALMAQSTTHWTIAAAMLPHKGFGQADAHVTLSTGIMSIAIAFHDEVDVTGWLLYANRAIFAGRGLAQSEGQVFTEEGDLVASYSVQGMIREFSQQPAELGLDSRTAM